MRIRHLVAALAVLASLGAPAGAAQAAAQMVNATSANRFVPALATVNPGDAVTFHNAGGFHSVVFDDGRTLLSPSGAGWTVMRVFPASGAYAYHCAVHGRTMSGLVHVNGPAPTVNLGSAVGRVGGFALSVRSTQTGLLTATVFRRLGSGAYVVSGRVTGTVRAGVVSQRLVRRLGGRPLVAGRYKVVARVRGGRLSAPRTLLVSVS